MPSVSSWTKSGSHCPSITRSVVISMRRKKVKTRCRWPITPRAKSKHDSSAVSVLKSAKTSRRLRLSKKTKAASSNWKKYISTHTRLAADNVWLLRITTSIYSLVWGLQLFIELYKCSLTISSLQGGMISTLISEIESRCNNWFRRF